MNEIRSFKPLHSLDKALDLDISRWTEINALRHNLLKDTFTTKSLFTRTKEAFNNNDFELASKLYLEIEDSMDELRNLYSIYKKNLLDL